MYNLPQILIFITGIHGLCGIGTLITNWTLEDFILEVLRYLGDFELAVPAVLAVEVCNTNNLSLNFVCPPNLELPN